MYPHMTTCPYNVIHTQIHTHAPTHTHIHFLKALLYVILYSYFSCYLPILKIGQKNTQRTCFPYVYFLSLNPSWTGQSFKEECPDKSLTMVFLPLPIQNMATNESTTLKVRRIAKNIRSESSVSR